MEKVAGAGFIAKGEIAEATSCALKPRPYLDELVNKLQLEKAENLQRCDRLVVAVAVKRSASDHEKIPETSETEEGAVEARPEPLATIRRGVPSRLSSA
jgi:hypothetical protein